MNAAVGDYYGSDDSSTYLMNVCAPCTIGGACPNNSTICRYTGGAYSGSFGNLFEPYPEWSLFDNANPGKGVKLSYANGDLCNGTVPVSVVVNFLCDPNAPYKGVFSVAQSPTEQCSYTISLSTPNSCPIPITPSLRPATPTTASVPQGQLSIWQFPVSDNTSAELKVDLLQISPSMGNLNLFLRYGALPTTSAYDYRDATYAISHQIVVRGSLPKALAIGNYYIGVLGLNTANITYNLTANLYPCPNNCSGHGTCDVTTHLCACDAGWVTDKVDCSATVQDPFPLETRVSGYLFGAQTAYYRVQITDNNAFQFFIDMTRVSGTALPALLATLEEGGATWPSLDNCVDPRTCFLVRDTLAPSPSWELAISFPTPGTWMIAVVGSQDAPFNYTLTAHVYDCPRNCSGHGTCDPNVHICTCDPGWDLLNDCSQDKTTLSPSQPYTFDLPAFETFYYQISVNGSQASLKTDLVFEIYPLTAWENPPTIYILFNHIPSQTEYYLASPFPLQQDQAFTIPYTDLQSGVWYIAVQSNYNDYQKLQLQYSYVADCTFCKHGKCDESKAATCSCDSGWQGVGCDVATDSGSSDSGTSVGVAVALVFVFLFVGIAVGILIKREFPSVCGTKGTASSAHYEDESDPVTGTNELPAARTSYT